jgi:surfactin synthase thioesterase subunit
MISPWFVRPKPKPNTGLRLFCFAHAGGAASAFHPWGVRLEGVEVWAIQLPGREGRLSEPLLTDFTVLQQRLADELTPHLDRPFAFFGHSMGAILAYEIARELRQRRLPTPERLYVSGRRAPTLPNLDPPLYPLPDREFIAELKRRFAGLPAVILAEPELLALFLPILRADLTMLERHHFKTDAVLDVPMTACGGQDDPQTSPAALAAWRELTTNEFAVRHFPGGHFYLHEQRDSFLPYLAGELNRRLRPV